MDLKIRVYWGLLTALFVAVNHVQGKDFKIACATMLTLYSERPKKLEIIKFSQSCSIFYSPFSPSLSSCYILTQCDIFSQISQFIS